MIRIPFSQGSEAPNSTGADPAPSEPSAVAKEQLETRMLLLENRLSHHAEELKTSLFQRVERIESRVVRALVTLGSREAEESEAANVVEFSGFGTDDSGNENREVHHLPASAAVSALNELNDTLELTRNHMEALDASVSRMREALRQSG